MNAIWWDKGDCRGHLADKIHDKLCKIERNSEKNLFEEKNYWKKNEKKSLKKLEKKVQKEYSKKSKPHSGWDILKVSNKKWSLPVK